MARQHPLSAISNPLITSKQLLAHQQRHTNSSDLDTATFKICLITQSAGILLRLPQEVIATSIILLQRYLTLDSDVSWPYESNDNGNGNDNGNVDQLSTLKLDSPLIRASSASIYLSAKQSFYPLSPRSITNVYSLLTSQNSPLSLNSHATNNDNTTDTHPPNPKTHYISEGTFQTLRQTLFKTERQILDTLAFDTKVTLPYTLALTYLHALSANIATLSERVISHLNAALLSPQLLYLTHQPHALAVAAIYLSSREIEMALVDEEVPWWEVFDVEREELGFLVLSLGSLDGFVAAQRGI